MSKHTDVENLQKMAAAASEYFHEDNNDRQWSSGEITRKKKALEQFKVKALGLPKIANTLIQSLSREIEKQEAGLWNDQQEAFIKICNGSYFDLNHPEKFMHLIDEFAVAKALSQTCRFTGHTNQFYSVAQHSVLVSHLVDSEFAFHALMHDAHEILIGDMSSPLKSLLPEYQSIDKKFSALMLNHFKVKTSPESFNNVHHADVVALVTEHRDLFVADDTGVTSKFPIDVKPIQAKIIPVCESDANSMFVMRFNELTRLGKKEMHKELHIAPPKASKKRGASCMGM